MAVVTGKPPSADKNADGLFFELVAGIDITKLPLNAEEGFVLSRMMSRRVSIPDLNRETGISPTMLKTHLESMMKKGAVTLNAAPSAEKAPKRDPYAGIIFSPADMADGRELSEEQKKRILFVEMHLDDWNHYKLLDLRRSASGGDIKAGYFKASKEFHPDTFFRKDIGKYAERVDRIFRAMKAAYDVLSRPVSRSAYDETLVGELSDEELEELSQIADVKKREVERQARLARAESARKASRLRWNPMTKRLAQAREMFRLAEDARKAGRIDEAATHARLACTYDEALKVRAEPILLEADALKTQTMVKRIHAALQYGDKSMEADIKRVAEEAAQIAEGSKRSGLLIEVAAVLLLAKMPQRAFRLATLATELDEKSAPAWKVVAEAAAQEEKWALAARAADRWLALEPQSGPAKAMVKAAKEGRGSGKV
jgi:curved DNA-binding protein CbpA